MVTNEIRRAADTMEEATKAIAALRVERDTYRAALLAISVYANCPRGIYSILLDALDGES